MSLQQFLSGIYLGNGLNVIRVRVGIGVIILIFRVFSSLNHIKSFLSLLKSILSQFKLILCLTKLLLGMSSLTRCSSHTHELFSTQSFLLCLLFILNSLLDLLFNLYKIIILIHWIEHIDSLDLALDRIEGEVFINTGNNTSIQICLTVLSFMSERITFNKLTRSLCRDAYW